MPRHIDVESKVVSRIANRKVEKDNELNNGAKIVDVDIKVEE